MTAEEKCLQLWLRQDRREPTGLNALPPDRRDKVQKANRRLRQLRQGARGRR
jgi:hypothetical protein